MLSELFTMSVMPSASLAPAAPQAPISDEMRQAAQDFEASYIAQMLTFSGLGKALTTGGGEDMSAFTSFYIQSFADDIAENGGFGLAEQFYDHMKKVSDVTGGVNGEDTYVDFGKL